LTNKIIQYYFKEYESYTKDRLGGDSFYVRTHFNYSVNSTNNSKSSTRNGSIDDLNFKINDILHITDTLHNGVIGQWIGTKLNNDKSQTNSQEPTFDIKGIIPNQKNAEHLVSSAKTIEQLSSSSNNLINILTNGTNNSNTMSLGASARMSIRKKLAGKGSLAKRSKSASRSNINSDTECKK
jgi:hypothetical protein